MVRCDPGPGLASGILASQTGGVTVNGFSKSMCRRYFGHDLGMFVEDSRPVHHFREVVKAFVPKQTLHCVAVKTDP